MIRAYGEAFGPAMTEEVFFRQASVLQGPLQKLRFQSLLARQTLKGGNPRFVILEQIGGRGVVIQFAVGPAPGDPKPDYVLKCIDGLRLRRVSLLTSRQVAPRTPRLRRSRNPR